MIFVSVFICVEISHPHSSIYQEPTHLLLKKTHIYRLQQTSPTAIATHLLRYAIKIQFVRPMVK